MSLIVDRYLFWRTVFDLMDGAIDVTARLNVWFFRGVLLVSFIDGTCSLNSLF